MRGAGRARAGGGGDGDTVTNSITITDITGITGDAVVEVAPSFMMLSIAKGEGTIASGTLTVALKNKDGIDWTGAGDYCVWIEHNGIYYFYSNGKKFSELDITEDSSQQEAGDKLPKLSINSASTSVAFSKFVTFSGK